MTSILEIAGDFEAESVDGRSPLEAAVVDLSREVARIEEQAVRQWAEQCSVTPEEWLRVWRPVTTLVPGDETDVRIRVEAEVRP